PRKPARTSTHCAAGFWILPDGRPVPNPLGWPGNVMCVHSKQPRSTWPPHAYTPNWMIRCWTSSPKNCGLLMKSWAPLRGNSQATMYWEKSFPASASGSDSTILMNPMKGRLTLLITALLLAGAGWLILQKQQGPQLPGYEIRSQPLVQTVVATGRVAAL